MTDYHTHIGQYKNKYFFPADVFRSLKEKGVSDTWFSSTTSCVYCKESEAAKNDKEIFENAPTAHSLFDGIKTEMIDSVKIARSFGILAHPLYWVVPEICNFVSINEAMADGFYKGFKLHPRAQNWDLNNKKTLALADEIFSFANKNSLRILIHCDNGYSPLLWQRLIAKSPSAIIQLAHLRPIDDMLYMLKNFSNVVCDTAFAQECDAEKAKAIYKDRVIFGSDFPIANTSRENNPNIF